MADTAFTSAGSGPWSTVGTWTAGASYPGEDGTDTATIASGHNVTLDVADFAGAISLVTVQSGGTLTIGVNQTAADIVALTVDAGGVCVFATGASYTLRLSGAITVNGTLTMDASGAGSKHTLEFAANSSVGATATITIKGRSKTVATQFDGAPNGTTVTVDDNTGWEDGDYLCGQKTTSVRDRKAATLASGKTYACALSASLQDGGRCLNLTRSAVLIGNTSKALTVAAGATVSALEYVELQNCHLADSSTLAMLTGISVYDTANQYANIICGANKSLVDCVGYLSTDPRMIGMVNGTASAQVTLTRCILLSSSHGALCMTAQSTVCLTCDDCEASGASLVWGYPAQGAGVSVFYARGCHVWGCPTVAGIRPVSACGYLDNCVFGKDIGGNDSSNTTDIDITLSNALLALDHCLLTGGTPVSVGTGNTCPRVVSTNHGQVSGARVEYQRYGTCTKSTAADFTAGVADVIDPSSASYPFRYSIWFPCDTGKTPTLTFNQQAAGTLGACTVALGYSRCGLTAIATGGTITPDTDGGVTQHSVTFTGTTDCAGEVEVIVSVLDGDGSDTLSIGDIAVSGNL